MFPIIDNNEGYVSQGVQLLVETPLIHIHNKLIIPSCSLLFSLIELLDYPVVYLDLAKESNEIADSEDKDNHESDSDKELTLSVSPYRQLAQEVMVMAQKI